MFVIILLKSVAHKTPTQANSLSQVGKVLGEYLHRNPACLIVLSAA